MMNSNNETPEPIEIPPEQLSAAALRGVIESFVLREGTEYGAVDHSLEEKVAQVMIQLHRGEAHILFDPESRNVELTLTAKLQPLQAASKRDPTIS